MHEVVSLQISDDEVLIRGILDPNHVRKKGDLKVNAFLPRNGDNSVSLNRYRYADEHFCKKHAKNLKSIYSKYSGLAAFCVNDVKKILGTPDTMPFVIIATPLDENGNNISNYDVYTDTLGNPSHCEIFYDYNLERDEPNIALRETANKILKCAKYHPDPNPDSDKWEGKSPLY